MVTTYLYLTTTTLKIPQFFRRGIRVPLYWLTISLVEIWLWSYFQNNIPILELPTIQNRSYIFKWTFFNQKEFKRKMAGMFMLLGVLLGVWKFVQPWLKNHSRTKLCTYDRPKKKKQARNIIPACRCGGSGQLGGGTASAAAAARRETRWQRGGG